MSVTKLKKGLDIKLKGKAAEEVVVVKKSEFYTVRPTDFRNLTPKIVNKVGTQVKAGTPLFRDKYNEKVLFTSPVSGELVDIKRGERRKILEFVIKADDQIQYEEFKSGSADSFSADEIKEQLLASGLWTKIVRRPFGIIPKIDETPLNIFISTFDSAPLAPNYNFTLKDSIGDFQAGVDILAKLTDGKVHIILDNKISNNIFANIKNADIHNFQGKHPVGNVGVQIEKIKPIDKGDVVWTVNPQDVVFIGRLFSQGKLDLTKIIALAGSEIQNPKYYKIISGAAIADIINNNVQSENVRYISGNVLTGTKIEKTDHLCIFDNLITVIPEGNKYEMFGWIKPGLNRYSNSRTHFSFLKKNKEWELDTNVKGGVRAFIVTGEMDRVLPMNILPMQLVKAAIAEDIDTLEKLGIYEILEEDLALCEFVNTSKIEIQDILSKTIQLMIKETE